MTVIKTKTTITTVTVTRLNFALWVMKHKLNCFLRLDENE